MRTSGRRTGSRIDPLGVLRRVEVFKGQDGSWDVDGPGPQSLAASTTCGTHALLPFRGCTAPRPH